MKRIAAALALLTLLATSALAGKHMGPPPDAMGPLEPGKGILKMIEELKLTPEQKRFVAQTLKDARAEGKALREAMKAARENLGDVMDKTPGDEALVRKAAQAMAKAGEDMAVFGGKLKAKLESVLTPEQRAAMTEKKHAMRERFKDRFDKGGKALDEWIDQQLKS
jgi:periplasmic protein CpxP/Spy